MSVVFKGMTDAEMSIDYQGVHEGSRTFKLLGNLTTDNELAVIACLAANGIATFLPHPNDPLARCTKVSVRIIARITDGANRGVIWEGVASYGAIPVDFASGGPLNQPATWRMDPEPVAVPAFVDRDGNPIVNTAGDFFDPPLTYERLIKRLTVFRNEAAPNLLAIQSVENRVNNAQWLLWGAGQVKALPIKIPERLYDQESSQYYYPMEYAFDIDPDGWDSKIINAGFGQLNSSGDRERIFDKTGQEITEAALLDMDGHKLAQPVDPEDVVILEFPLLEEADFSVFNFDGLVGLS